MDIGTIRTWLRETKPHRLDELWAAADHTRREIVGDAVHLRGLIEIGNYCNRNCAYCGLRTGNRELERYRMPAAEILGCAHQALEYGYGTVVMQAGDDPGIERAWLAAVIERIKSETGLAVTLSLGERPEGDLAAWRGAGADRYLLRFETSDQALYRRIHPPAGDHESPGRIALLRCLQDLGYEAGSGVMVGIPGQTYESLADDIALFRELDLDMVGIGPFLPHPATPLGSPEWHTEITPDDQVPNTDTMTCKVVALTRLVCPEANLPSTTALATKNPEEGHILGLQRGANVVMPNLTPDAFRGLYEIYPSKQRTDADSAAYRDLIRARIHALGRTIGKGSGGRIRSPEPSP